MPSHRACPHAVGDIPWKWLSDKTWRERTFLNHQNYNKLAVDGFVYIESENQIVCFFCHLFLGLSENVEQVHRLYSPQCPMVQNAATQITSMDRGSSSGPHHNSPAASSESTHYFNASGLHHNTPAASSESTHYFNASGLHHNTPAASSESTSNFSDMSSANPTSLSHDSVDSHHSVSQSCNQSNNSSESMSNKQNQQTEQNNVRKDQKPPTYAELGIVTERPKRTQFAIRQDRLKSFDNWPRDHHIQVDDLVKAGFYYAGFGDCARCFNCGGGLRNWDVEDDVYVEHSRWFPKCGYIRQLMGQIFIDEVQELMKTEKVISRKLVMEKIKAASSSFPDTENELSQDAAVRALIDQGYDKVNILQAANSLKEHKKNISADDIIDQLAHKNITISQPSINRCPTELIESGGQNLDLIKRENVDLRQQKMCKICMDKEVAIVFLPCGHFASCVDCCQPLKTCPVCRSVIKGTVRAFLS
ncbi:hypothetical protein Btru_001809 [Bulinus truncatus]|nr:hypothetical protein Btru_001809 [Bulinus truncatus]